MNNQEKAADAIDKFSRIAYNRNGEHITRQLKGKKIYLSGQITGKRNYKGLFLFAERLARFCDASRVFNPASQIPDSLDYGQAMRRCVVALAECDAIVMLPGWNFSKGAKVEHEVAKACGMNLVYIAGQTTAHMAFSDLEQELARLL